MLAAPPVAGLLSGARPGQVAAQLALAGLKHARHPLATGQGQTCPSLRACDASKAPGRIPAQPFYAPLPACEGGCPLPFSGWRLAKRKHSVSAPTMRGQTPDRDLPHLPRTPPSGTQKGWGGSWRGALLSPSSAAARWACAEHM